MRRATNRTITERQNGGGRSNYKDMIVQLKPDDATGQTVRNLRIVGLPIEYKDFTAKKRNANNPKEFDKVSFPDEALNKSFSRIGHDDENQCPWKKLGFISSNKYSVNVLERQKDGTSIPKVLNKGIQIFQEFTKWELANHEMNLENGDDSLCTALGGAVAHDVRIKAEKNASALGGVKYTVAVNPKTSILSEEEIEMLRAIHEPTAAELAADRAAYEADREQDNADRDASAEYNKKYAPMPEWEDFFTYGHDLAKIFKHTPIRTAEAATETSELAMSAAGNDDEQTPAPTSEPAKAKAKPKEKAAPAAVESTDDVEAVEDNPTPDDDPGW